MVLQLKEESLEYISLKKYEDELLQSLQHRITTLRLLESIIKDDLIPPNLRPFLSKLDPDVEMMPPELMYHFLLCCVYSAIKKPEQKVAKTYERWLRLLSSLKISVLYKVKQHYQHVEHMLASRSSTVQSDDFMLKIQDVEMLTRLLSKSLSQASLLHFAHLLPLPNDLVGKEISLPQVLTLWTSGKLPHAKLPTLASLKCILQTNLVDSCSLSWHRHLELLEKKSMPDGGTEWDLAIDNLLQLLRVWWSNLAFAVLLPNEISDLLLASDSPQACLSQLLTLWISNKLPSATHQPTFGNLVQLINRDELQLLINNFVNLTAAGASSAKKLKPKIKAASSSSLRVTEGCSAIIGCQFYSIHEDGVSLQWQFEGSPIREEDEHIHIINTHSGPTTLSFLCVQVKNLLMEGKYSCLVKNKIIHSTALFVITPIDKHRDVLTTFFNEEPEVPKDNTWPPVCCRSYINLALIHQDCVINKGEYCRLTIRGDMDDILSSKESIIYETAFNIRRGTRLLVEGRPGSGKSTLMHKVSKDWAHGKLNLRCNRLLFLAHLRAFCSDPAINLKDIVGCYYNSSTTIEEICEYADHNSGLGLCFVLDGLDEYLPKKENNFIFRLISKKVLPMATVIVASRPAAAMPFRKDATVQVEVIGFLKEQIYNYVKEYPFSCSYKRKQLRQYFEEHPNVLHSCYLPVHSAMVCFLFNELNENESMPQVETEIYKEFTNYTILRFLYRQESEFSTWRYIKSTDNLSPTHQDHYKKICRLAYEMTTAMKQVMKDIELKSFFDMIEEVPSFGLVTIDAVATRLGFQRMYTFLHLTFQEFLAAHHISTLERAEQLELIAKHGNSENFQQVWKFYCGLVNSTENFKALICNSKFGSLFKIQCCFETQQQNICDFAVENNSLSFSSSFLSASNFTEVAYILHNTSIPVTKMSFTQCTFGRSELNTLVKKASKDLRKLTMICYQKYDAEQLGLIKHLLNSCTHLKILDISNTPIGEAEMNVIMDKNLKLPNLEVCKVGSIGSEIYSSVSLQASLVRHFMSLSSNGKFFNVLFSGIGKISLPRGWPLPTYFHCNPPHLLLNFTQLSLSAAESLKQELCASKQYTRISLVHCGVNDTLASCLSQGFESCTGLEMLELSFNNIGDSGARDIVRSVNHCKHLHTLDISFNRIASADMFKGLEIKNFKLIKNTLCLSDTNLEDSSISDIVSMLESLSRHEDIQHLSLNNNRISVSGLQSLSSNIIKFQNLLEIDLSSNLLGLEGATVLANVLKHLPKINQLDISSNLLCNSGASAIAKGLQNCPFLFELKISSNHIGSDGARALVKSLRSCMILQTLKINSNCLKSEGAKAISSELKCWSNLSLDIRSNFIGKNGAKALAEAASSLRELFIGDNNIGNDGLEYLITAFRRSNKTLQALDICFNNITSDCPGLHMLPDILKESDVTVLSIGHNKVDIHSSINLARVITTSSTHLLKLDIGNTHILDSHREALAHSLGHCTHLQELNVTNNAVTTAIDTFAESLESMTEIQALYMGHNAVGLYGAELVASSLCHCPDLHTLHINNNCIRFEGICALVSVLKCYPRLSVLDISHNDIISNDVDVLSDILKESKSIRKLDISGNHFCHYQSQMKNAIVQLSAIQDFTSDQQFGGFIKSCSNLQQLKLNNQKFNSIISEGLKYCRNLRELSLNSSCMDSSDLSDLTHTLSTNCKFLSVLDLSNNKLGTHGVNMLISDFQGLKRCIYLQSLNISGNISSSKPDTTWDGEVMTFSISLKWFHTLDISRNNIQERDFRALMKTLPKSLMHLYVSQCKLSAQGAQDLASMLEHHPALLTLDVSGNSLGDEGAVTLAGGLESSLSLQALSVHHNNIGDVGAETLLDTLLDCTNLVSLCIDPNPISPQCMKYLKQILSDNGVFVQISTATTGPNAKHYTSSSISDSSVLSDSASSVTSSQFSARDSPVPKSTSVPSQDKDQDLSSASNPTPVNSPANSSP